MLSSRSRHQLLKLQYIMFFYNMEIISQINAQLTLFFKTPKTQTQHDPKLINSIFRFDIPPCFHRVSK